MKLLTGQCSYLWIVINRMGANRCESGLFYILFWFINIYWFIFDVTGLGSWPALFVSFILPLIGLPCYSYPNPNQSPLLMPKPNYIDTSSRSDLAFTLLHTVASSQGGHGGLKKHDAFFRRGHYLHSSFCAGKTPQSSEHSHTEKSRKSCVELIVLISFVATHLAMVWM